MSSLLAPSNWNSFVRVIDWLTMTFSSSILHWYVLDETLDFLAMKVAADFSSQCLSQVHQQVNIEKLNVLFLAFTPHKGSSSNLSALFWNLYPLLPNLKVSPNLSSWPSPFCLPVLSEAAHLLYSHPTRPDWALQSPSPSMGYHELLRSLVGVPWAPWTPEGTPRPLMCQYKILAPLILARTLRLLRGYPLIARQSLLKTPQGEKKGRVSNFN